MADCLPSIVGGCGIEIIKSDACGIPVLGANNYIRSKGFVRFSMTPEIEAGTAVREYNMCGDLCVDRPACPIPIGFNAKLELCKVDPAVLSLLLGYTPIMGGVANADIVGMSAVGSANNVCNHFSMKIWGVNDGSCGGAEAPYVVFILPHALNPVLSSELVFAKDTKQTWAIDFVVRDGNALYEDPGAIFADAEVQGRPLAWKCAASIPAYTNPGEFGTIGVV